MLLSRYSAPPPCRPANARGLPESMRVTPLRHYQQQQQQQQQQQLRAVVSAASAGGGSDSAPAAPPPSDDADDGFEGLAPEEDAEVPGGYAEAMSASTRLGKAIRSACDELDTLAALEDETLREADALLAKLGVKGSLFGAAASGIGAEGGPRDALAALKRAMEQEAQAQAAHERSMAAKREAEAGGGEGGGGGK